MNLYFLDKENKQRLVTKNIEPGESGEGVINLVLDDLKKRRPGIKNYYQRVWWDEFFRLWIDFGSHTEFYICQDPKMAINSSDEGEENG